MIDIWNFFRDLWVGAFWVVVVGVGAILTFAVPIGVILIVLRLFEVI